MSEKHTHGGPAFPQHPDAAYDEGLMMRDWFAGQALVGMLSNPAALEHGFTVDGKPLDVSHAAFYIADCMLKAREE